MGYGNNLVIKFGIISDLFVCDDQSSSAISTEESWSSVDPKGSKFAQWFHFEEEKPSDETTSSSNILSLFAKREKVITIQGESHGDGGLVSTHNQGCGILPMPVAPSLEDIEKMMAAAAKEPVSSSKGSVIPAVPFNQDSPQVGQSLLPPVFMTCEDIEQSLLAEAAGNDELLGFQDFPSMMSTVVDTSASQHLLSLLQKQPSRSETLCSGGLHSKLSPKEAASEWAWRGPDPRDQTSEVHTLEALFGKDFMSELQLLQAPLPEKRFSAVKEKVERTAPFFSQSEDKYPFEAGADEEGRQLWYGVSGPALSGMWPDSKEVDAGHRDFGDGSSSQPLIDDLKLSESEELLHPISAMGQGLWGNQNPSSEQMLMDSLNGTTSTLAGPSFRSVINGHANINRVDNGEYLKGVADREGTKEESFSSTAGGNSRLLPVGDKLSLLTRTEAAMNGISLLDATKRQNLNRSSKPPGKVKDGHVNGVTRLLPHGNGPQIKAVARTAGFASFPPEGHLQQHYGPQSPPVLIEPHTHPATLERHQQASRGPSNFLFLHQSARAQATSPVYSHGNMDYEVDSSTARTFPAPGQVHFQPPPQAFHEGMAHQLLGPTQILQHSPFVTTMGMQEHESGNRQVPLGASLSPPGHHGHRQLLQSHVPQMGFMSQYSSEFGNQGYKLGGYWGGTTSDSWLGMDGNLSGSPRPGLIHEPSLGARDDLKFHFR
jgi:hypothetical protein